MKNNQPEDNLEYLYNNALNDLSKLKKNEGWNVPSSNVWEKLATDLEKEKKPNRILFYWRIGSIAAGVLLLLSAVQLYRYNQKVNHLSNQLNKNEQVVKGIQSQLQTINQRKGNQEKMKRIEVHQEEKLKVSPQSPFIPSENITASQYQQTPLDFEISNLPIFSNDELEKVLTDSSNRTLNNNKKSLSIGQISKLNNLTLKKHPVYLGESLAKLPNINNLLPIANQPLNISKPMPSIVKPSKVYLAAEYGAIETSLHRKGFSSIIGNLFPTIERNESSYIVGLKFGFLVNKKWTIETGLNYLQSNSTIQHNRAIPYQLLQEELNNQGNYESALSLQLSSSAGVIETDVLLSRSATSEIETNTSLDLDIRFSNSLTYLEVPILLRRHFSINRFQISINAGFANRFLVQKKFDFQNISSADRRFQSQYIGSRERLDAQQTPSIYSINYLIGGDLTYRLIPKLDIYLAPTFSRSIQPIVEVKDAKVFTQNKSISLGIRYTL